MLKIGICPVCNKGPRKIPYLHPDGTRQNICHTCNARIKRYRAKGISRSLPVIKVKKDKKPEGKKFKYPTKESVDAALKTRTTMDKENYPGKLAIEDMTLYRAVHKFGVNLPKKESQERKPTTVRKASELTSEAVRLAETPVIVPSPTPVPSVTPELVTPAPPVSAKAAEPERLAYLWGIDEGSVLRAWNWIVLGEKRKSKGKLERVELLVFLLDTLRNSKIEYLTPSLADRLYYRRFGGVVPHYATFYRCLEFLAKKMPGEIAVDEISWPKRYLMPEKMAKVKAEREERQRRRREENAVATVPSTSPELAEPSPVISAVVPKKMLGVERKDEEEVSRSDCCWVVDATNNRDPEDIRRLNEMIEQEPGKVRGLLKEIFRPSFPAAQAAIRRFLKTAEGKKLKGLIA